MRKIMLIAALAGIGFAGSARADKSAPPTLPAIEQNVGNVIAPEKLEIAHISDVSIDRSGIEISPGVVVPGCVIRVELQLPDGSAIQLQGDTRLGNGNGRLTPVNLLVNLPNSYELGRFALVGRRAVVLEIRGANGLALMGLFREANLQGSSGLVQVMGTGWMVTNGHVLRDFKQDISTRSYSTEELAGAYNRAQTIADPALRARQFMLEFVGNGEVPDVQQTSSCRINCGRTPGSLTYVQPLPGPAVGVTVDPYLR